MERVPLTDEQITEILDELPKPPGSGETAVNVALNSIKVLLRDYLEEAITLPNVPEAFQEFKEEVVASIYKSFIEAGSPVGVQSGTALSAPLTQMTLNTFHFAGQKSGVSSAFNMVRDLLNGSKINRNPAMKIYLKQEGSGSNLHDVYHVGTESSIYDLRPEFEMTTIQDCILDIPIILTRDEAIAEGIVDMINLHSKLRPDKFVNASSRFQLNYILCLNINNYRLYTHKIPISTIASVIESKITEGQSDLVCVWKSQFSGKFYIIVDESRSFKGNVSAITHSSAVLTFLESVVIPSFSKTVVKGIRGIYSIEPREISVMNVIDRVQVVQNGKRVNSIRAKYTGEELEQYVILSEKKTRLDGASLYDVYRLLVVCGFNVKSVNIEKLEIGVQYNGNLLPELIDRAVKHPKEAKFFYIYTNGENYEEIIWRDDIDLYRTYPLDSHKIVSVLGIDAGKLYLSTQFISTLDSMGQYVNSRHIDVMFSLLTNLGIINSLTYTGVNRRSVGAMAAASHQRSMDVITNSSAFGENAVIAGISSVMYVGQQSKQIGTGSVSTLKDITPEPADRPSLAPEVNINGEVITSSISVQIRDSDLSDLFEVESEIEASTLKALSVDKVALLRKAPVTNVAPIETEISLPPGAVIQTVNNTMVKAISNVTNGGFEAIGKPTKPTSHVTPMGNILDLNLDELTGLSLIVPGTKTPVVPISELPELVPHSKISEPIPLITPEVKVEIPVKVIPKQTIQVVITNIPVSKPAPAPTISFIPIPPSSIQKDLLSDILSMLPSNESIQESRPVSMVNVAQYASMFGA